MQRRSFLTGSLALAASIRAATMMRADEGEATGPQDTPSETLLAGPTQGPWRRLFLDAAVVEQQQGLRRVFHAAEKHPGGPVVIADQPWEGKAAITGPYVYGTVFREGTRFRLWYQLLNQGNHVGYAESTDGIHWHKPRLGLVQFQGSEETNLVVSAFQPEKFAGVHCHNPSVILRPDDPQPERRYALYGFDGASRGPRVAFSPDGLRWSYEKAADAGAARLLESSDVVSFFSDPYGARYGCTWKTRNRRGRAVGMAVSSDGQQWQKVFQGPVFAADDHDPDNTQVYGMPVFAYQGLYIGLPWIYAARYFRYGAYSVEKLHEAQQDSPRTIDVQLAWSWDLVNWTRPLPRGVLIPRGPAGAWDSGMIVTARAPIVVGDELWFYYGGTDKVHDEPRVRAAIGLARLRLDGFCSLSSRDVPPSDVASPAEGWLITRREPFRTPRVWINARTGREGHIVAEILDRRNRVVPGFSREECQAFSGDSVRHLLGWQTAQFPASRRDPDYKIRFWLRDAELFSYLPEDLDPAQPDLARFPGEGP